jgi:hypothetical protein
MPPTWGDSQLSDDIVKKICNYMYNNSTAHIERKFEKYKKLLNENNN